MASLKSINKNFPKFSLPYSLAFMELISQLSNGTMGMLRLPSLFSFPSISLGTDTTYGTSLFLALLQVDVLTWRTRTVWVGSVHYKTLSRVEALGSPVFPCKPIYLWYSLGLRSDQYY